MPHISQSLASPYETVNRFDIQPPKHRQCVWVCNLLLGKRGKLDYVANQVKELCSQAGRIYSCKLCESKKNKGTFHARVEFCSVQAAQRAVANLDRTPFLCGRTVRVHASSPYAKTKTSRGIYFTCEQACLMANMIFGFDGWSHEIVDATPINLDSPMKISSSLDPVCRVHVQVRVVVHARGLFAKETEIFGQCTIEASKQIVQAALSEIVTNEGIECALHKKAADGALLEALKSLSVAHIRLADGSERMVVLRKNTNSYGHWPYIHR